MSVAGVDEARRLDAVRRYDILDTPPDGAFDRITALAARLLDAPIAIVSIVDSDRIWFKSHHGLDITEIERAPGLCASAILQYEPWVVADAVVDPRTLANPLVAGDFGLRFYAGVPLTTSDGYNLGTLCVIDQEPREVEPAQVEVLADLASLVMDELELRLSARRQVGMEAELRLRAEQVACSLQETLLPTRLPSVPGVQVAARYHVANREEVGGDFYDLIATGDGFAAVVGDACGKGTRAAALTGAARWALRTAVVNGWRPAGVLGRLNAVLLEAHDDDAERYCTVALAHLAADSTEVTVSLGGHPQPLLVRCDGSVERVGSPAPAVGWLAGTTYDDVVVRLEAGETLVLFTDGLFEAIGGHGTADDEPIASVLAGLAGEPAESVAAGLDRAMGRGALTDDAAFLVLRRT